MLKNNKWQLLMPSVVILLPAVVGLLIWNRLPDRIATHWSLDGTPDGWSGKSLAVFGIPAILFILHWVCVFFTARDPKNKDKNSLAFRWVVWILPVISLMACGLIYAAALGSDVNIGITVRVLIGLLFVILGSYMPKCRQNYVIGIKVAWTLRDEENWDRTHRFAGRLWVSGGLFLMASVFADVKIVQYVFLPLIFIMAFAPMIYSYIYYRKQKKS